MKKPRDNNVDLIYELENKQLPPGAPFDTHAEAQSWVDEITASEFWTDDMRLPKRINIFSHGDLDWSENKSPNEIWLCNTHLWQSVVLHELAHFYPPGDGHGPQFVRAYLGLIAQFMGLHYSNIFRHAFIAHKIQF